MTAAGAAPSDTAAARLSSLLRGRAAPWLAVVLAVFAGSLALDVGLATDDYTHRQFVLAHLSPGGGPGAPWDMFDAYGRAGPVSIAVAVYAGFLPWWTSPNLKAAFFRPLAVATHFVDWRLWPEAPWWMHLHSALWYAGLVGLVALYLRRVMGASVAAGLAAMLYAIDEAHVEGLAWIAGRNTLMSACFAAGVLVAHERARAGGRPWALPVAALSLGLGLASGEGAIAAWPYLVGHALFVDRARPIARALALLPLAAVTLGWQLLYRSLGYGGRGSGVYIDPLSEPRAFVAVLPERFATAFQEQLLLPGWMYERVQAHGALDAACLVLLALAALPLWRILARRAEARMLAFGMLGSLLPICATPPVPRLLFVAGIGGSALTALLIVEGLSALSERARRGLAVVGPRVACAAVLLLLHAAAAPLAARSRALVQVEHDRLVRRVAASLPRVDAPGTTLVVLEGGNYLLAAFALLQRTWESPSAPPSVHHVLGSNAVPVRLTRRSKSVLVLAPEGGYLADGWSRLVRHPDERFSAGQVTWLSIGSVTVEAITSDGRPARLRLEVPDPDAPGLVWVAWDRARDGFVRVSLPPVGASVVLGGEPVAAAGPRGGT